MKKRRVNWPYGNPDFAAFEVEAAAGLPSQASLQRGHALSGLEKHREKMDDADQGMEAGAATIRDRVRRQNAVTLNYQQGHLPENLRPSTQEARLNGNHLRRNDSG